MKIKDWGLRIGECNGGRSGKEEESAVKTGLEGITVADFLVGGSRRWLVGMFGGRWGLLGMCWN